MKKNNNCTKWFWLFCVYGFVLIQAQKDLQEIQGLYFRAGMRTTGIDVIRIDDHFHYVDWSNNNDQEVKSIGKVVPTSMKDMDHQFELFGRTSFRLRVYSNDNIDFYDKKFVNFHELFKIDIDPKVSTKDLEELFMELATYLRSHKSDYAENPNYSTSDELTLKIQKEYIQTKLDKFVLPTSQTTVKLKFRPNTDDVYIYSCCFISTLILSYTALKYIRQSSCQPSRVYKTDQEVQEHIV